MGTSHTYECEKCHKTVFVSLENVEGRYSKVKAMKCNDCGEIGDCIISQSNVTYPEPRMVTPMCEECGSENVVAWDIKCRKCNIKMVDKGAFLYWD